MIVQARAASSGFKMGSLIVSVGVRQAILCPL